MAEAAETRIAGRYRLVEQVGSGGMGVVWEAYDDQLHRTVAAKQLIVPPGLPGYAAEDLRRRAIDEGRIAAKLLHHNAITVYDVVEDHDQTYLIMEYLPSIALSHLLAERGSLPAPEVARIGAQVAAALASAHHAGVVHRDVKPGNVLIAKDGSGVAKITDFGISRVVEDAGGMTTTGLVAGTPAYLSPEVAQGERATFASDVFSLGATLYTAVEGVSPFGALDNAMALLYKVASGDMNPPVKAGPLTEILGELLAIDPEQRPAMDEVQRVLAAMAVPLPSAAAPATVATTTAAAPAASPPGPPPERSRRKVAVLITAGLLLVAVGGGVTAALLNREDPAALEPPPSSAPQEQPPPPAPTQAPEPPPSSPPPSSPPPSAPPETAGSPADAVIAYYGMLPGNLDQAWAQLTPKYQAGEARSRGTFNGFWATIQSVEIGGVTSTGENTVEATIRYLKKGGGTAQERRRFTLVQQDGAWKIDNAPVV